MVRSKLRYGVMPILFNALAFLRSSLAHGFAGILLLSGLLFPLTASAESKVILALGDSLMAGYGLAEEESFPSQLQRALDQRNHEVRVINGGVSGDTSTGGVNRLDWLLADQPDLIIIELGANDGLRALPPDLTEKNLAILIEKSKAAGAHVVLTGMRAPPNLGPEYEDSFNSIYPRLAEKHQVDFYPFFLEGVAGDLNLNLEDGIHPTGEGIAIIVENMLPLIEAALKG